MRLKIFRHLITPNSLLLIAAGAIVAVAAIWLMSNGTDVLFDLLSLLILLGLAGLLATILSRWMLSKVLKEKTDREETGLMFSAKDALEVVWQNRNVIFTVATFLVLLSVFRGLVGVGELMVGYLQVENLRSQNSLVQAQSRIALTDLLRRTIDQEAELETEKSNLYLAYSSWTEVGMPRQSEQDRFSRFELQLCEEYPSAFSCEVHFHGIEPVTNDADELAKAMSLGIAWYRAEFLSGYSSHEWAYTFVSDPAPNPRHTTFTQSLVSEFESFPEAAERICGVAGSEAQRAMEFIEGINKLSASFELAVEQGTTPSILGGPGLSVGMHNDMSEFGVNLSALRTSLNSDREFFENPYPDLAWLLMPFHPESDADITTDDYMKILTYFLTAEAQLLRVWAVCDERLQFVDEALNTWRAQRAAVERELAELSGK